MQRIALPTLVFAVMAITGCSPATSPGDAAEGRLSVTAAALELAGVGDVV